MIEIGGINFSADVYETSGKKGYNATFDISDADAVRTAFASGGSIRFNFKSGTIELVGCRVEFYYEDPRRSTFTVGFSGITVDEDAEERLDAKIDALSGSTEDSIEELNSAIDDILVMFLEG